MSIDAIILLACLLVNSAVLTIILLVVMRVNRIFKDFKAFITPVDDKTPSPLANFTQVIADMAGRSIVATIKSTFMGKQSGESRASTAIQGNLAIDSLAGNPIGAILTSFPSLAKSLKRNPQLLDLALQYMGKHNLPGGSGAGGAGNNGNNGDLQSNFKL